MIPMNEYPASSVVPIFFATYGKTNGESITLTGLAVTDIEIYKGTSMTQRSSDAGYTLLDTDGIDIDGITGIHGFSVDLGDNTDAGFYAVGSFYTVVVSAVTVDSQTVNFIADRFRIVAAESVAGKPKVDVDAWLGTAAATPTVAGVPEVDVTHWLGTAAATPTVAGVPEVDVTHFGGTAATTASGRPEVNTTHAAGTAWGSGAITAASIAADAIGASELAADAVAEIADAIWDEDATGHQTGGTFGQAIGDPGADATTIYQSVVTDAAGTNVAADIIAVKADTAAILVDTGTTLDGRIPAALVGGRMDSSVGAVAANAITAAGIADGAIDRATFAADTGLQSARSNTAQAGSAANITLDASASATNNFYRGMIVFLTGGTGVGQYRLIVLYDGGTKVATITPAWATNPDATSTFAVLPRGAANLVAADGGAIPTPVNSGVPLVDTTYVTGALQTAGDIIGDTNDIQGRLPAALVGGRMDANVGAISSDATAADNAEAFFDGTGYAGTNNVIPQVTTVTGNVNGSVGSVTGAVGSVTGAVGSVTGAVGSVTGNVGGNVTGSVGSLAAQAKADVNAEVVDCLNVDTYAEPGQETPSATNTLVKKLGYLFKYAINKITQDSTTLKVYNSAGAVVDQKATVSDDGTTYTRGVHGTGP